MKDSIGKNLSYFRERLSYNPSNGQFIWDKNGKLAGTAHHTGYTAIQVGGKKYLAHRLAFLFLKGRWPLESKVIDHKNGVKDDNRACNIQEIDFEQNVFKQNRRETTPQGMRGICWREDRKKWICRIGHKGKRIFIGYFDKLEDATCAYEENAKQLFGVEFVGSN